MNIAPGLSLSGHVVVCDKIYCIPAVIHLQILTYYCKMKHYSLMRFISSSQVKVHLFSQSQV